MLGQARSVAAGRCWELGKRRDSRHVLDVEFWELETDRVGRRFQPVLSGWYAVSDSLTILLHSLSRSQSSGRRMLSASRTAVIPYRRPRTSRFSGTLASCHLAPRMTRPPSWDPGKGSQLLTWPMASPEHSGFVTGEMIQASSGDEELCKEVT